MNKNKIIILVFLVVLSFVLAGFYGFKILKKVKQEKLLEVKQEKSSIYEELDKKGAIAQADYLKTQAIDNLKKCNDKGIGDYKKCVTQALSKNSNASIDMCQEIIDDKLKKFCLDDFNIKNIVKNNGSKDCYSLGDDFKSACLDTIFMNYSGTSDCSNAEKADKSRCLDLVNYKQGTATSIKNNCELISNSNLKNDCLDMQKQKPIDTDADGVIDQVEHSLGLNSSSSDTDGDGLSDSEELYKYHSNPNNPDTDGDGTNDGVEVKNGFNPNGPGKLDIANE